MGLITDLHVTFISLVKRPATGKSVILRSADPSAPLRAGPSAPLGARQRATCFAVRKMDAALQRVYGIVYAPGEVDTQGDTADAAVIRRAATRFLREYNQSNVDVEHSYSTELAGVAESWLVRSGDPLFPEEPEGAWAVGIQIYDPELWARLEAGELTGLSLAGMARYAEPDDRDKQSSEQWEPGRPGPMGAGRPRSSDAPPRWFERWLRLAAPPLPSLEPLEPLEPPKETPMNEDEIKTLLKSEIPALVAATLAAQKSAEAADAEQAARAAEFAELKTAVAELTEQVKQASHKGAGESGAGGGETLATSLFD